MKKVSFLMMVAALSGGSVAFAQEQPLTVIFEGCEPIEVISHDDSCNQGGDPVDQACRSNGAVVRWAPEAQIGSITPKDGGLSNCKARPGQGYYQCVVRGNVGDEIYYNVTSKQGCTLDPVIIIK